MEFVFSNLKASKVQLSALGVFKTDEITSLMEFHSV